MFSQEKILNLWRALKEMLGSQIWEYNLENFNVILYISAES